MGKLPEAIDAGALIQYCLTSHSKERERLKLERLFKPISAQSHTSLCLILLWNPILAFWLFGYEIIVTREQVNNVLQLKMEYNDTSHSAGLKADLLAFRRDKRFLNTLE